MDNGVAIKSKFWPSPQDYNEAIQNPQLHLADEELKAGSPVTNALGLPRPISGSFATVYKWQCANRWVALRCFLKDIPDTQWRYGRIADYLQKVGSPHMVNFEFEFKGVQVGGRWFPILKMDWVEGLTLDNYLRRSLAQAHLDGDLAESFRKMCALMQTDGIAHGDLQHGNIMVSDGSLILVDYDGMFVPHINAPHSNELGHRNYQHPKRTAQHFGAYLDNFSAWVIYLSLEAMAKDKSLCERLGALDDCLLFRADDFKNPRRSCAFAVLETHDDNHIRHMARALRSFLDLQPEAVPPLNDGTPPSVELAPVDADAPRDRPAMKAEQAAATPANVISRLSARPTVPASDGGSAAQPAVTHLPATVEPELKRPSPRRVRYNARCLRFHPAVHLAVLLCLAVPAVMAASIIIKSAIHYRSLPLAFLLAVVLMPVIACIRLCAGVWSDWQVVRRGIATRGRVVEKRVEHKVTYATTAAGSVEHDKHKCWVVIEYPRAQDGRVSVVRTRLATNDDQFRELTEGEELTVLYLPSTRAHIYRFNYFRAV